METKVWREDHKNILEVKIQPSAIKPHFAQNEENKWLAYIRVKDNNILANRVMLKVWKREQGHKGVYLKYRKREDQLLKALEENLEMSFSQLQKTVRLKKYIVENLLANLICIDIIKMNISEEHFTYSLTDFEKPYYQTK